MKQIKVLFLLQGLFCVLFYNFSQGLTFFDHQTTDYLFVSHDSYDNRMILMVGAVCFIAAASLFIVGFFRASSDKLTLWVVGISFVLQIIALMVIEVGSVYDTIAGGDIYLILALTAQLAIVIISSRRIAQILTIKA